MNKITRTALLLLILASVSSPCSAQRRSPSDGPPPPPPAPAVEYNPNAWKEFVSREGLFSVRIPAEPKLNRQQVDTPFGTLPVYFYIASTGTGGYMVGYNDFPKYSETPDFVRAVLGGARDKVLAVDASRKLLGEKEITIEGRLGQEWLIANEHLLFRAVTFLDKGRFYQLLFVAPLNVAFNDGSASEKVSDRTDFYEDISKRFFGSFKLLAADTKTGEPTQSTPSESETSAPSEDARTEGEVDRLLKDKSVGVVVGEEQAGPSPRSAPASKRVVSGGVLNGKASYKPQPVYPPIAKAARAQGIVTVKIIVDEDGKVLAAQAESGHPLLQAAAVKAAREARFVPTQLDGRSVKVLGVVTYNFILQ